MSFNPSSVRVPHQEFDPRVDDAPSPKPPPVHPVVAAILGPRGGPHFIDYSDDALRDKDGLRVAFAFCIPRAGTLKEPWVLVDFFDASGAVREPNGRTRRPRTPEGRAAYMARCVQLAEERGAIVAAYAKRVRRDVGYIPYVAGAELDKATIAYAKAGGIVPLIPLKPLGPGGA